MQLSKTKASPNLGGKPQRFKFQPLPQTRQCSPRPPAVAGLEAKVKYLCVTREPPTGLRAEGREGGWAPGALSSGLPASVPSRPWLGIQIHPQVFKKFA